MQAPDPMEAVLALLDTMIAQQREKVLKVGNRLNPRATADDLLNPFDWPEIASNPQFNFEDGILAGLVSAHTAIAAQIGDRGRASEIGGP